MTWPRALNSFEGESLWSGERDAASLDAAYAECRAVMRHHAHAFYFSSRLLPAEKQRAIWAIYAVCRASDDLVDRAPVGTPTGDLLVAINRWEQRLRDADETIPLIRAFTDTRRRYNVPMQPLWDLLEGVRADLTRHRYATWADLERYCYCVASTIGLLVTPVLGYDGAEETLAYAARLGIAMQLTNILRDVGEDAGMGRVYLPQDEMAAFGYSDEKVAAGVVDEHFRRLMRFQIARARDLYRTSTPAIARLHRSSHLPIHAAATLYGGILGRIEALDYQVYTYRAHLRKRDKVLRLPAIWWQARRFPRPVASA